MIMVSGQAPNGGTLRFSCVLSDVTYSPHVFDVTVQRFEDEGNATSEDSRVSEGGVAD